MTDDVRVAVLAAFAVGAGAEVDAAWTLAAEVHELHPDDLKLASREVVRRAQLVSWSL